MSLRAGRDPQAVNEKNLFHGTTPDSVEAICKQNFDWRLHGRNASSYGEGSYFAVSASYSHSYAKRDGNMSQFMFLTKVLVGSYAVGRSNYRRPPLKQPSNPASDLYDSCVNNKSNPTIFVVFDTDQLYPEYIIQYSSAQPETLALNTSRPQPKPNSSPNSLDTYYQRIQPARNISSNLAPTVAAQPKAPTRNTAGISQLKPASSHPSIDIVSLVPPPSLPAGNNSSYLAPAVYAQPKATTLNTAARPRLKPAGSHPSLNSLSTVSKPSLPAGNSSTYLAPAASAQSNIPTGYRAARPQPRRASSHTSLYSGLGSTSWSSGSPKTGANNTNRGKRNKEKGKRKKVCMIM